MFSRRCQQKKKHPAHESQVASRWAGLQQEERRGEGTGTESGLNDYSSATASCRCQVPRS